MKRAIGQERSKKPYDAFYLEHTLLSFLFEIKTPGTIYELVLTYISVQGHYLKDPGYSNQGSDTLLFPDHCNRTMRTHMRRN